LKASWTQNPVIDFSHLDKDIWFPAPELTTSENYQEQFRSIRWGETEDELQIRITAFQQWVISQGYKEVAVVGHSAYFKHWLKASEKMPNCHIETTTLG